MNPSIVFPTLGKMVVALLLAAAGDFLYATVAFVHMQLAGALRDLWLVFLLVDPAALTFSLGVFCLSFWFVRKPTKAVYVAAFAALLAAGGFWSFVNEQPLSGWLLPPVHGK